MLLYSFIFSNKEEGEDDNQISIDVEDYDVIEEAPVESEKEEVDENTEISIFLICYEKVVKCTKCRLGEALIDVIHRADVWWDLCS